MPPYPCELIPNTVKMAKPQQSASLEELYSGGWQHTALHGTRRQAATKRRRCLFLLHNGERLASAPCGSIAAEITALILSEGIPGLPGEGLEQWLAHATISLRRFSKRSPRRYAASTLSLCV
jgi:hypothetical protein